MAEYERLWEEIGAVKQMMRDGKFPVSDKEFLLGFYDNYRALFNLYATKFTNSKTEADRKRLMLEMADVFSLAHLQLILKEELPDDLNELVLDYDHHPDEYPGYEYREKKIIDRSYSLLRKQKA